MGKLWKIFFLTILTISYFIKKFHWKELFIVLAGEYLIHVVIIYSFAMLFTSHSVILLLDLLAYTFVYVTCPAIIAYLFGKMCSNIKNDVISTIMVTVLGLLFMFNIVQEILTFSIFGLSDRTYTYIANFFQLFNTSLTNLFAEPNAALPFHVSNRSLIVIFFWILILLSVNIFKRKKIWSLILGIVALVTFISGLYVTQENEYYVYTNQSFLTTVKMMGDSWNYDYKYYSDRNMKLVNREVKRVEEEYSVENYDIQISCGDVTRFVTKMSFESLSTENYIFSLYHGYKVKRITDESGKNIPYKQEGDLITIATEDIVSSNLIWEYEGIGKVYYASDEFICYPGYFYFYPIVGNHLLYDIDSQNYNKLLELPETQFAIKVDADYEVYSNLDTIQYNSFEGYSTGPILMGGKYVDKVSIDNTQIVYSKLEYGEDEIKAKYDEIISIYRDGSVDFSKYSWFVCPYYGGCFARYYVGNNYLFGNYEELTTMMPLEYKIFRELNYETTN